MLFAGDEDATVSGLASTQLTLKAKAEQLVKNEVKKVLLGTKLYDDIEVASNLVMDFSHEETVQHDYTPAEDQTQGVLSHEDIYTAENVNGISGIPGTDTNADDETTYVTQDNNNSSSNINEESRDYLPNEKITTTTSQPGAIDYDKSSIYVTAINYVVMNEDDYEENAEESRKLAVVKSAIGTLSFSEMQAIIHIFDELDGMEGVLVASKIADRVGITRSVIVNALRKFESAGVIESRSSGMKGTYIKVINDVVFSEIKKLRQEM